MTLKSGAGKLHKVCKQTSTPHSPGNFQAELWFCNRSETARDRELFNKESPLLLANKKSLQHKIFSGKTAGLIEVNVVPPSDKEMGLKELGKSLDSIVFKGIRICL